MVPLFVTFVPNKRLNPQGEEKKKVTDGTLPTRWKGKLQVNPQGTF